MPLRNKARKNSNKINDKGKMEYWNNGGMGFFI
jgi:hypothetical protein